MSQAICKRLRLNSILRDLGLQDGKLIRLYRDNKDAIDIAHNLVEYNQTKHVEIDRYFIKDHLEKGNVCILFVQSQGQLADIFTKCLSCDIFKENLEGRVELNHLKWLGDKDRVDLDCRTDNLGAESRNYECWEDILEIRNVFLWDIPLGNRETGWEKASRLCFWRVWSEARLAVDLGRGFRCGDGWNSRLETVARWMGKICMKLEVSWISSEGYQQGRARLEFVDSGLYYILQVIQEDRGSDCYVFRKWGRVGNDKIGGNKLEEMSKSESILAFKRLFLEKTGNSWEAWEQGNFEKQPGRFCPLDIDYGVDEKPKKNGPKNIKSKLAPLVEGLMKMLFNVETYRCFRVTMRSCVRILEAGKQPLAKLQGKAQHSSRAAMLEFQIDMTEMPLGKLSKKNIQKDALQDIEIASSLVGFDGENDDTLDEKYLKLQCEIAPLPHDSEDFQMVKNYLLNTHAPTHKDWRLELEDVFTLDRKGEFDKYATYRDKLKNKMLLWHG
ncbi:Poly [ADP-ribose] polymerase 1 [Platanthera zijinensis]|uniref:Poly [ADP-ribose] polymerase n=1 Tax=Platanthera zijinensis TaxID=2320716 RepID=A0AAP0G338_9ASPA